MKFLTKLYPEVTLVKSYGRFGSVRGFVLLWYEYVSKYKKIYPWRYRYQFWNVGLNMLFWSNTDISFFLHFHSKDRCSNQSSFSVLLTLQWYNPTVKPWKAKKVYAWKLRSKCVRCWWRVALLKEKDCRVSLPQGGTT